MINISDEDQKNEIIKNLTKKFSGFFPGNEVSFLVSFIEGMLLMHRFMVLTESYFKMQGTSKGRFMILVRLFISNEKKGESISDLLPFYPISPSTMSGVLDTLEKDKMIERTQNPMDKRKVNIKITETGKMFLFNFFPRHIANVKKITSKVSDYEREILPVLFKKLNSGIIDVINELDMEISPFLIKKFKSEITNESNAFNEEEFTNDKK